MRPIEVTGGIYIDYGCNGIIRVGEGVFIPTGPRNSDTDKEYNEDLSAFLDRWFSRSVLGENDVVSDSGF
jgi:hypothetical protein